MLVLPSRLNARRRAWLPGLWHEVALIGRLAVEFGQECLVGPERLATGHDDHDHVVVDDTFVLRLVPDELTAIGRGLSMRQGMEPDFQGRAVAQLVGAADSLLETCLQGCRVFRV